MKTCIIEDCESEHHARGMCAMHYWRWQRHGDPLATLVYYGDPEAAFLARAEPIVGDPAHIIWTGATNGKGYGSLTVNGRKMLAHRYAWQRVNGPIPDGREVDHKCWEPSCVNPEHLRLATRGQNSTNRSGATGGRDLPRGVYRKGRRYRAVVQSGGQYHYLGTFDTPEAASLAAATKRNILFGAFAGGN